MNKNKIIDKIWISKNFLLPKEKLFSNVIASKNIKLYEEVKLELISYDYPYIVYKGELFNTLVIEEQVHHYVLEGEKHKLYLLRSDFSTRF